MKPGTKWGKPVLAPPCRSLTAVLDAVRLGPADDAAVVTAGQLRAVWFQSYAGACKVIRVISLGAKIRKGGPQKPVPRLV
jgi:hypothetical protein